MQRGKKQVKGTMTNLEAEKYFLAIANTTNDMTHQQGFKRKRGEFHRQTWYRCSRYLVGGGQPCAHRGAGEWPADCNFDPVCQ